MRIPFIALALAPLLAHSAEDPVAAHQRVEANAAAYDQAFDYYAELCAVTEYHPFVGDPGGTYGHAFLLVKGACRDTDSDSPKLKFCSDGTAGVSVDSDYQNVKWTAVDGRSFMLYGDVAPGHSFTQADADEVIQKAVDLGIFKGVKVSETVEKTRQKGESYEHMVSRWSLGTNYGATLARNMNCTRIPLDAGPGHPKEAMVQSLVNELNRMQDLAAKNGSNWDYASNNCTHTAVNALAAIGYGRSIETEWDMPNALTHPIEFKKRLEDIAIPADEMLHALLWGNDVSHGFDPKTLNELQWSPHEPGVIVESVPMHSVRNEVYKQGYVQHFGDGAISKLITGALEKMKADPVARDLPSRKWRLFQKLLQEPANTDLRANLEHWDALLHDRLSRLSDGPVKEYVSAKIIEIQLQLGALEAAK